MLANETFDQLQVVATLRRRCHELCFEKLVEAKQRRIALQLILDELRCRGGAVMRGSG